MSSCAAAIFVRRKWFHHHLALSRGGSDFLSAFPSGHSCQLVWGSAKSGAFGEHAFIGDTINGMRDISIAGGGDSQ